MRNTLLYQGIAYTVLLEGNTMKVEVNLPTSALKLGLVSNPM